MNAKGETLRPSPAWEALLPGSSLGSAAWKPWEEAQELPGPVCWPTSCHGATVLPVHHGVSERTRAPPGALAHWAWRHGQ